LLSYSRKKYIAKVLPNPLTFLTLRPRNQLVYTYSAQGESVCIFELPGEPLVDLWRQYQGEEMKLWVGRCGGIELAFLELIRYCVRMYTSSGVSDILPECFRVSEGRLCYLYDTWMRGTYEIVMNNDVDI
jgi:hypothetical protein